MTSLLKLTAVLFLVAGTVMAGDDPADAGGWPMYHQDGDYVAPETGLDLVDKAADMRLVFNGPMHMGAGKTSTGGFKGSHIKAAEKAGVDPFNGGTSSPIVADGVIYMSYFRPSGDVVDSGRYKDKLMGFRRVAADDMLTAIDAETGKLKWQAVEKGKGVSRGGRKRVHWGVSPAYADGVVYAMGSTGRLYAYDARSGKKKWESDIGPAHEKLEKEKAEALKQKKRYGGESWKVNNVVADDVLVTTDGWNGLMGFDTATGKRKWHAPKVISRWATPAIFRHDGREYLLVCADREGTLRLLDPRTGQALWKKQVGGNVPTIVLSGDTAILNVRNVDRNAGIYGGLRISTTGAEVLWQLPDDSSFHHQWSGADNAATRWVAIRDDIAVLLIKPGDKKKYSKYDIRLLVLNPQTGAVYYDRRVTDEGAPETKSKRIRMPILMEDRLLLPTDQNHGNSGYGAYYYKIVRDEDGKFKTLDFAGVWPKKHYALSGYETPIEIPYVAGRLYFRSLQGIACYDLRKQNDQ